MTKTREEVLKMVGHMYSIDKFLRNENVYEGIKTVSNNYADMSL